MARYEVKPVESVLGEPHTSGSSLAGKATAAPLSPGLAFCLVHKLLGSYSGPKLRLVNAHVDILLEGHEVENEGLYLSALYCISPPSGVNRGCLSQPASISRLISQEPSLRTPLTRQTELLAPRHMPCFLPNAYAYAIPLHLDLQKCCILKVYLNTIFFLKPF